MKDQIQFETNGLTVLAVKVPEDAKNIEVTSHANITGLLEFYSEENWDQYIDIPEGNWKYHCTDANEILKKLVKSHTGSAYHFDQDSAGGTADTFINEEIVYKLISKLTKP